MYRPPSPLVFYDLHNVLIPNALIPNVAFPNYSNPDRDHNSLFFPMDYTKSTGPGLGIHPSGVAVSQGNGNWGN